MDTVPPHASYFLTLPLEVRLKIYEFFYADTTLKLSDTPTTASKRVFAVRDGKLDTRLLLLNRQIYHEAVPVLRSSTKLILTRITRELDLDFLPPVIKGSVVHVICNSCHIGHRALQAFTSLQLVEFRQTENYNAFVLERTRESKEGDPPHLLRFPIRDGPELQDYIEGKMDQHIVKCFVSGMKADLPAWVLNKDHDWLQLSKAWYGFNMRVDFSIVPEFIDASHYVYQNQVSKPRPGLRIVLDLPEMKIVRRHLIEE